MAQHRIPHIQLVPALRVEENLADGRRMKQIRGSNGRCYQFVRSLFTALMGKVIAAVECELTPSGQWVVPDRPTLVAVKQMYKWCMQGHCTTQGHPVREDPLKEAAVLAYLGDPGHNNVMRLLDVLEDADCVYIVLEYMDGGELFAQVEKRSMTECLARRYFYQLVMGTKYLHDKGIAHRDQSLENALLTSRPVPGTLKIIDFGLAMPLPEPAGTLLPPDGHVGKERYMAPEMYASEPYDGRKVDIWELGVCLFVLLFGIYPYKKAAPQHCPYFAELAQGNLVQLVTQWGMAAKVSPEALDLVNRIIQVDPALRPSLDDVLRHPWFAIQLQESPPATLAAAEAGVGGAAAAAAVAPGGGAPPG